MYWRHNGKKMDLVCLVVSDCSCVVIYMTLNFTFPLSLAGYFVLAGQVIHENIRLQFSSQSFNVLTSSSVDVGLVFPLSSLQILC